MGAVATFDFAKWQASYPEFSGVTSGQAAAFFDQATIYLANDGSGPVSDAGKQLTLLNMLVAHIAALSVNADGTPKPPSSPVGRISSASEGSVSAQFDMGTTPGTAAWYQQTRYGAAFYAATAQYRTMRYRVSRAALYQPAGFGFFGRYR